MVCWGFAHYLARGIHIIDVLVYIHCFGVIYVLGGIHIVGGVMYIEYSRYTHMQG